MCKSVQICRAGPLFGGCLLIILTFVLSSVNVALAISRDHCPQGLVVAIGAANFALSEVQADFLHRKGYNLIFILCVVIKAIGYLLCAV